MANPIDIVANAIRAADPDLDLSHGQLAEVAAAALTHDEIVHNAVVALFHEGWESKEGMDRTGLVAIARTVLRSVGGA